MESGEVYIRISMISGLADCCKSQSTSPARCFCEVHRLAEDLRYCSS